MVLCDLIDLDSLDKGRTAKLQKYDDIFAFYISFYSTVVKKGFNLNDSDGMRNISFDIEDVLCEKLFVSFFEPFFQARAEEVILMSLDKCFFSLITRETLSDDRFSRLYMFYVLLRKLLWQTGDIEDNLVFVTKIVTAFASSNIYQDFIVLRDNITNKLSRLGMLEKEVEL